MAKKSKKTAAKKTPVKKAAAKKSPAQKAPAKKASAKSKSAAKPQAAKSVKTKVAKKSSAKPALKVLKGKAQAKNTPKVQTKSGKAAPKLTLAKTTQLAKPRAFVAPLEDRVLIFRVEASDRTPGGLYIPDTAMARPNKGQVLAVGPGRVSKKGHLRRLDVRVGDTVLFGQYHGQTLEFDGTEYVLLREEEILGVVEE